MATKLDKSEIISRLRGQEITDQIASCPIYDKKLIRKTLFRPSSIHAMEVITPSVCAVTWYEIKLDGKSVFSSESFSDVLLAWDKF